MGLRGGFVLLFVLFLQTNIGFAQPELNKWSVSTELLLPSGRTNSPFRSYLNGLVDFHPRITCSPLNHWFVSAGPKFMYYTISEFKVPEKMNGGMQVFGGDLEIGYTTWPAKNFGIDFGVKVGVANYMFKTDSTRTLTAKGYNSLTSMYYQPNIQFILLSDEAVAYRWIVGYNIAGFDFKPEELSLGTNGGYALSDFNQSTQTFLVGFGMTYYLGNKRSDTDILENFE